MQAARQEFAAHGYGSARIDRIAARIAAARRMIYYHFGSKDGLYLAVLADVYAEIRARESALALDSLPPEAALRRLIQFTFAFDAANPDLVRIIDGENIQAARFLARLPGLQDLNASALGTLSAILARGQAEGLFRRGATALDLHYMISACCFFRVANRATFSAIFGCDLSDRPWPNATRP